MEDMQKQNHDKIKKIKESILKISQVVESDLSQNLDLLAQEGITEQNMFVYMGLVEQRINELLQAFAFIRAEKGIPLYNMTQKQDEIIEKDILTRSGINNVRKLHSGGNSFVGEEMNNNAKGNQQVTDMVESLQSKF